MWFWGRTLDFSRFLLPLQALRCTGSRVQAAGRVLVTLLQLLLLPGQLRGSLGDVGPGKRAPGEPDLPESFPSREDFPFPPWLPLLLLSTWLPLFCLFGFFSSSITTTGRQGLGYFPGRASGVRASCAALADNWTFPAVCCCCGFHFIVLRWFFAMLMESLGLFFPNKPCWPQPGSLRSHTECLAP